MNIKDAKKIVFKIGTSTLTHDNGKPNYKKIEELVRILADLKNEGKQIVLVSSGAIAVGVDRLKLPERPKTVAGKQAAAAIGQCELMFIYDRFFSEYNTTVAQVLLTKDAVDKKDRKRNIVNTLTSILDFDAIPIVNENDTVATDELVFGDNDTLSAVVAECVDADLLVIITDIDGLYDDNPRTNPNAQKIDVVEEITPEIFQLAGGSGTSRGTGGMVTKLQAAQIAMSNGFDTAIISGNDLHNIYTLLSGEKIGTIFKATEEN